MADQSESSQEILCPSCGGPMQILSTLEGEDQIAVCATCPDQPPLSTQSNVPLSSRAPSASAPLNESVEPDRGSTSRFRELLKEADAEPPSEWPESLLEDLPKEIKELLQRDMQGPRKESGSLSEDYLQSMRTQGYVITEDSRGMRITGAPKGASTSDLSATDLVRMAAELNGGVLPQDKRRPCPQCQATIPPNAEQCQWCGYVLPADDKTEAE